MKTVVKLSASFFLLLGWIQLFAQECEPYFIDKQGAVIEMASYDKKDKLTGTSVSTVKEVKQSGSKVDWLVNVVSKDAKGKELSSGDMNMSCQDGVFKMDMRNFIDEETMKGFEGMEVTMDAKDLEYPREITAGMKLPDGSISIKVASQGMPIMNMVVKIYDRKVEAIEDMTTPAGTYSCYKISQTIETKTMFTVVAKSIDWITKKVGTVRSETYDKNGNLQGYTVLTAVK